MNLYVMTIDDAEGHLLSFEIFQSAMMMDELQKENWWEIADNLGLCPDEEHGETIDIDPIINPKRI